MVPSGGLDWVMLFGRLHLVGYVLLFILLQSPVLWFAGTRIPDRWPDLFRSLQNGFPRIWLDANQSTQYGIETARLYFLLLAAIASVYFYSIRRLSRSGSFDEWNLKPAFKKVWLFTLVILALLLISPGMFSGDVYSYIWYGRIFALFGGNPYVDVPLLYVAYDGTNWIQWLYWKDVPSAYGPVWLFFAGIIAQLANLGDGDIVNHILGHKVLAAGAHLLNVWLVWHIARIVIERYWQPATGGRGGRARPLLWRMAALEVISRYRGGGMASAGARVGVPTLSTHNDWRASARIAATVAYAWNPLLLIEFGVSAHNDVLMLTMLLVAIRLHLSGQWRWAVFTLALASLVKLPGLFFLPAYIRLIFSQRFYGATSGTLRRTRRREGFVAAAQAVGIVATAWALLFLPFWEGGATLKAFSGGPPAQVYIHSIGSVIRYAIPKQVAETAVSFGLEGASEWNLVAFGAAIDGPLRLTLLAVTVVVAVLVTRRARSFPRLLEAWGWTLFAYLTIGTVWFWPWYASWLILPALLVGPGRLWNATQIYFMSSLAMYGLNPSTSPSLQAWWDWSGLIAASPPLLYVGISWLFSRQHARQGEPKGDPGRPIERVARRAAIGAATPAGSTISGAVFVYEEAGKGAANSQRIEGTLPMERYTPGGSLSEPEGRQ